MQNDWIIILLDIKIRLTPVQFIDKFNNLDDWINLDMTDELEFATQLAQKSGELLLDSFSLSGTRTTRKKDQSVVTKADMDTDRLISEAIGDQYPEDGILSEELNTIYPSGKRAVWIIDPIDGTTNYSLGLPIWGVSIARLVDGWPDIAVVYFPQLDEIYSARKGAGAFLNSSQLRTIVPDRGQTTTFFACCSRTHRRFDIQVPYKPRILGSATYNLCSVARGIAILAFEAVPKIWDLAGGWLVATEAGAVVQTLDGSKPFPPIPGNDYAEISFPTLAAPTPEYLARGREQIKPR
jgi:myo-inositol-1(or 4)-monophosphatase